MCESDTPRKVNGLFVTECVCYPRTGHHMLLTVLQEYFGAALVYCEMYFEPEHVIDSDLLTNYQKNHDFHLDTPIHTDRRYLVQIRSPLDAWASYWEMQARSLSVEDTYENYFIHAQQWKIYYSGFVEKWLLSRVPNRLVVRYEDLLAEPMDTTGNVIQFLQGSPNTDTPRLREALQKFPYKQRRRKTLPFLHIA